MPSTAARTAAEPPMSLDQLTALIDRLAGGASPAGSRFGPLYQRIRAREQHLFNSPSADPRLPEPFEDFGGWQTDAARRAWSELRVRLREHPLRVHVEPPNDSERARAAANDLEQVFEHGLVLADERSGAGIQGELAYGQVCLCYGVLHWQRAFDRLPPFPQPETRSRAPSDPDERRRFRDQRGRLVECAGSRRERDRRRKAEAGFPWRIEVVRPDQFAFIEDRLAPNGIGVALVLREVALSDYQAALARQDRLRLALGRERGRPRLQLAEPGDAPVAGDPSAAGWGDRVRVASVWTRSRYYELAAPAAGGWTLVKSHGHPYEMPPFALAPSDVNDHPDPVRRWEPLLEGVYRVKPTFDYDRSLARVIAEQAAVPLYWIRLAEGGYETDAEGGARVELTASAAAARNLPAGASLEKVEFPFDPAFIEFLRLANEDLAAAAPDTGAILRGEAGPNTQPHTLNLLLSARNSQVQHLKRQQARAARIMLRNMAMVMSKPAPLGGFGEPVWVFACTREGRVLRDTIVGVDPARIPSLDIDVRIDPYSQAQRIAIQEHGRARLNDPLDPLDQRGYLEQYIGDEHPEAAIARHRRWLLEQARLDRELAAAGAAPNASAPRSVVAPLSPELSDLGELNVPRGSV